MVAPTEGKISYSTRFLLFIKLLDVVEFRTLSSKGSSRLVLLYPLLHGQINFTDLKGETVKPSFSHSYRSLFKRQVIALPLHGQNTAAVELVVTGQAGPPILGYVAGGDVFGKQARLVFAEFLPFLLVFPLMALQCGGNDGLVVWFSWLYL